MVEYFRRFWGRIDGGGDPGSVVNG
jgi:hypothetical protein